MKHVFLYAYDKINLGDDLFIHTIVKRYPNVKFYIWSDTVNKRVYADLTNLKVVDKKSVLMNMINRICPSFIVRYKNWIEKHCIANVYIGGSIFIEYQPWEQYVSWWRDKAANHSMYVIGANWGPYETEEYRDGIASALADMQDVCFRDRYSYEKFSKVPTVRYAPDILFSYPVPKMAVKNRQLFVSLIDCDSPDHATLSHYSDLYIDNMVQLLQQYIDEGWSLVLASFCKHEGDEDAVKRVADALSYCNSPLSICTLFYDGTNVNKFISMLAESDYVIATRFHGIVLALAAGRPVLPVVYSDKTLHMLDYIGFNGEIFDLRTFEKWDYSQSRINWEEQTFFVSDEIRSASQKHFKKLDLILL